MSFAMHILILHQYALPRGHAGITRHGDIGDELSKRGHSVSIIASGFDYLARIDRNDGRDNVEWHAGVRFHWLATGSYRTNDARRVRSMLLFTWRATWAGIRVSPRPTVVIASSPHLLTALAGIIIALRFRVPYVLEIRDLWPSVLVDLGAIRHGSITHRALEIVERLAYRWAKGIVTVVPRAYRRVQLMGTSSRKCRYVPNTTSLETLQVRPLPASLQEILEEERGRQIIMYTGAHGVANDLRNVLEAIALLRTDAPDIYERFAVIFVGGGSEREELIEIANRRSLDHVHFHPPVPKQSMKAALSEADILLLHLANASAFRYGLSPNKLYDYLSAGRPILYSSPPAYPEVEGARAGVSFRAGDPARLADAIQHVVAMPRSKSLLMGERGRAAAEQHTPQAAAAALESFLQQLV
jgi:glycosyltransferase involved in cell wall biosynthesis